MKTIYIITGAGGFLGNNIIRALEQKNEEHEIRALAFSENDEEVLSHFDVKVFKGNVTKPDTLEEIFKVPANAKVFVIHAAAIVTIKSKNDKSVVEVNVEGTKNIVQKTLDIGAKLVYISSVHAIPEKPRGEVITEVDRFDPNIVKGIYAVTKANAANYILDTVKTKGLNACILHPSGMIGPNDYTITHMTKLIKDLASGSFRIMVHGGYDFVDVRDVASAVVSACENGRSGECYILANRFFSLRETADTVCNIMGYKKIKTTIPMYVCKMFAPLCEIYYNIRKVPPLFTRLSLQVIASNGTFSIDKAANELGYCPRKFEDTIKDTVQFLLDSKMIVANKKLQAKATAAEEKLGRKAQAKS